MKCSAEDFVRIWQQAEDIAEVLRKTRLSRSTAYSWASEYRALDIRLKFFRPGPRLPVKKLQRLAHEARRMR